MIFLICEAKDNMMSAHKNLSTSIRIYLWGRAQTVALEIESLDNLAVSWLRRT
jgi:hypothetical protein